MLSDSQVRKAAQRTCCRAECVGARAQTPSDKQSARISPPIGQPSRAWSWRARAFAHQHLRDGAPKSALRWPAANARARARSDTNSLERGHDVVRLISAFKQARTIDRRCLSSRTLCASQTSLAQCHDIVSSLNRLKVCDARARVSPITCATIA